ncbi:MAG: threonylcarbamoyl-AMP synthase [Cyclobacteriaceae bacterium]|nr:threonylcarbamoyl-AMP synthase [Cyclobacteriaceae bacterium]MCH8517535.1 threonylcarbamoyl-AMP synthase [Cyclobacteriaceae bacterium]
MDKIGTDVAFAAQLLEEDGIVAIATETVYGLAANAYSESSVMKVFEAKQRPSFDPLIVHTHSIEQVESFTSEFPAELKKLANAFWPGPLTLILPKNNKIPNIVTSGLKTVAVRIPRKTRTLELLKKLPFPLAAPSANPFGYISPTTAQHVIKQLGDKIDYVLEDGDAEVGLESTIVGYEDGQYIVYRAGGISIEEIEAIVGPVLLKNHSSSNPKAPGMLASHYAPKDVRVVHAEEFDGEDDESIYYLRFDKKLKNIPGHRQVILSKSSDLTVAARNLFASLRQLDEIPSCKTIVIEYVPNKGLGKAINDRLKRASAH